MEKPSNEPLVIPENVFSLTPLQFELKYLPEQPIKVKPVRFPSYPLGQHQQLLSSDFTCTWALANYFTTHSSNDESITVQQAGDADEENHQEGNPNVDNPSLLLKERTTQHEKMAIECVMPSWAATKSLLMTYSESA